MVLNAAVQMLREADDLKQKILQFKNGTSMLQEKTLWALQQQLQKVYEKVLVLDLDYALDKKVEQDLWNVGFKQQIEALQAISKDRKNAMRSEGQAMLSWVLQAAAGFYLCLLHQICTTFKLDLPFRRRASLLGWVEGWSAGSPAGSRMPPPAAARYICQHCLVHLGDLARYRQQLRSAHTFYRHALLVSAHSGQPYNQLALVAWRRGRRLGALYWHVRSLLVRSPFPPAPANLARTLHAAASSRDNRELPVIPGVTPDSVSLSANKPGELARPPNKLDSHSYVTELIRALHLIHTVDDLDTASALVKSLDSSLTALVATDSFESMTLIKMACVLIWLVHSSTEDLALDSKSLTDSEAKAAALSETLAASALQALLLPAYTATEPLEKTLPALKVWISWTVYHSRIVGSAAWASRPQLWPALAHVLNMLTSAPETLTDHYETVPLPEDEELHGFLPLEESLAGLKFSTHATWDTYAGRLPADAGDELLSPSETTSTSCLLSDTSLQQRVRARRLVALGERLALLFPEHLNCAYVESVPTFSAASVDGTALVTALAELSVTSRRVTAERDPDSDDSASPPPAPTVISEADFREKVREKRVGILKPQGSLERAREERALHSTQDEQDPEGIPELVPSDDKKESRKARVNIAMAAIMRKQEETNKQVKFVTPPPTPDSTADSTDIQDQPKIIQPKTIKSLANLPVGRKTGGILSLKDKSAGYPHLVNVEPEPKKPEKDDKKELKLNQSSSQNSQQNYQPKRLEHPTSPNWSNNIQPPNYPEPRNFQPGNFQKNYGIQNTGLSYNPNYQMPSNQGIRLPVVNPKEIDVRTAALQKQNARQELFQDGAKFGNNYQNISGDKKNFLNDLPPRFANQYRYWQTAQENQFNDNKFRDDSFKSSSFNPQQQPPNWLNTAQDVSGNFQQPVSWWPKQENPSYQQNFQMPMNIQPNFYNPPAQLPNPYAFNQMPSQNKPENFTNYNTTIGPPQQMQTIQNLVSSSSFNSLNNFGSYQPSVTYDSTMYPQFNNKMYQPVQKPGYPDNKMMGAMNFGSNVSPMQQRSLNFGEQAKSEGKNADQVSGEGSCNEASSSGNTYSLFSGAQEPASWGSQHHPQQQSLWSGPGPSPLERLLEQQKQIKQPPAPL